MQWTGWSPIDVIANARTADGTVVGSDRVATDLHLGRIIHEAKVASGENVGMVPGDQDGLRMQEGFILETVVDYVLAGMRFDDAIQIAFKRYGLQILPWVRQVHLEADGIKMTPDGLDPFAVSIADGAPEPELVSIKATRRTLRNARTLEDFSAHFWTWFMQEQGYLRAAGLRQVRWIVWWIASDYSKGKGTGPSLLDCRVKFDQEELDQNWKGVLMIADRLRGKGVVA